MKKFLIIDGSSVFYRAFYAMPALTAPTGEPTGALTGFANIILKVLREFSPDLTAVALDAAKETFRNKIFADYKATRPLMPDDLAAQQPLLKEFAEVLGLKTCAAIGYEADDVIGTLTTQAGKNFHVDILTGDRDALQLINSTTRVLLNKNSGVEIYDEKRFSDEYGFAPPLLVDFKGLSGDASGTIGLLNTGLAYFLYFSSMQRLPAQSVALISYIDPVSALLFSAWLLNENMTLLQIAGAVFIIGGAILGELGD